MGQQQTMNRAAIGFTVKSGWASAVLLNGSPTVPRVMESTRVELSDPADPDSRQPYHAGFGTARKETQHLSQLVASVKRFGRRSVTELIRHYQTIAPGVRGAGVVVGSLIDPSRIANDHIRIHALEGQLFRTVVSDAVKQKRLSCSVWRERDLYELAARSLKFPEEKLREMLMTFGRGIAGGWRAEQKTAALAAWIVLACGKKPTVT
jgi:hypothetical protein